MKNPLPLRVLGLMVAVALGFSACSEDGASDGAVAADSDEDTSAEIFVPIDITTGTNSDTNAVEEPTVESDFEDPCSVPDDCNSGWCIDGPNGLACTRTCIDSCPDGYACKNIAGAGADPAFICVSVAVRLCQPCNENADCSLTPTDASGNLCIDDGLDDGSFCGLNCGDGGWACPSGYECVTIEGAPVRSARQCVPVDGGACECNGAGIALGLSTMCGQTNEAGRCPGERFCSEQGLTSCDAPAAAGETCNGLDDDCDGATDEGTGGVSCELQTEEGTCPGVTACVEGEEVCEGNEPLPEVCNGIDDDCNGETDDEAFGCQEYFLDEDGDGFGGEVSKCLCAPDEETYFTARVGGDCDDMEAAAYPGAEELCDEVDNDCDDKVDELGAEGCESYYYDGDRDGYGTDEARCQCGPDEEDKFDTLLKGDCNDLLKAVNPGAAEICNEIDDNCDELTDPADSEGCTPYAYDGDNDGWGLLADVQCRCHAEGRYTATKVDNDCDDNNLLINPGGIETCNGKDDDCDDFTDEDFADFDNDGIANCIDPDNDNDGDPNESDCRPFDDTVYSWAEEICDDRDNDCDGTSDLEGSTGCSSFFFDGDGDGYGILGDSKCLCGPTGKYSATESGDCADDNPTRSPGIDEICDGVDNNCDGLNDPDDTVGCLTYYIDNDGDGWGLADQARCLCQTVDKFTALNQPDCNDTNPAVNPGETESCDGIDNDCDNQIDEGSGDFDSDGQPDCVDTDDDNDGDPDVSDCAPLDDKIHHNATEKCDNKDNDCDGSTDEANASGCDSYYYDGDNDGYGLDQNTSCLCGPSGKYSTQIGGDCNDAAASVYPGAAEICDGVDNNCDNSTDPENSGGCTTYYQDSDGDTYGHKTLKKCLCAPSGIYKANNNSDCYDYNANAKPNQGSWFTTNRGDGSFDYNCNGVADKRYNGWAACHFGCSHTSGWWGTNPWCGNSGNWTTSCSCCEDVFYCYPNNQSRTQACR